MRREVGAAFALFERIPVADRVTMLGLLLAMIDFTRDEETLAAYDRKNAHQAIMFFLAPDLEAARRVRLRGPRAVPAEPDRPPPLGVE